MSKQKFLDKVIDTLNERGEEYGPGGNEVNAILNSFNALYSYNLTPAHFFTLMTLMKMKRHSNRPKGDNWVDAVGYATICKEAEDQGA